MTENKPSSEKRIKIDPFYPRLVAAGLLAAAGAYFFVPYRGPVSALFLAVVSAALCAPLRLDWRIKAGLFALFGYFFHSAFVRAVTDNLLFALACAAISALCCLCRALLRRRTAKNVLLALLPAAAAVCLSLFFAGSPFSAFSADETLSDYVNSTYAADEFAASPVYYDRKSGEYRLDLHAEDDPTGAYPIALRGGLIRDAYLSYAESRLLEDMRLELVQALRAAYPSEGYTVVPAGISRFPDGLVTLADAQADYSARAYFEVYISNDVTLAEFFKRVEKYLKTLYDADADVSQITFRGGSRGEYHYAVTCPVTQLPINETPVFDVSSRPGCAERVSRLRKGPAAAPSGRLPRPKISGMWGTKSRLRFPRLYILRKSSGNYKLDIDNFSVL